ncbi:BPL-N domain-containing protein [uncultured Desulfovibrio sp.]|uniref:BPL-N domain-containing protein n=1 Tax=uncultured Desulfovibrio sp. TaxID=167968 RepID=UPI0003A421FE|nr:BPL-N domain-containing protein [uncultured Desulfovibrio sp.]
MQPAQPIHILWDASHIWGLMAWRALRALGLSCRLVKGQEIAEGALLGKPGSRRDAGCDAFPPLLLVPGGNARLKALALGGAGRDAVRAYVERGGGYLGFCGGAGLALSHSDPREGLQLCPWSRAAYPQRLHHLISGHVRVRARAGEELVPPGGTRDKNGAVLSLPVWWPGRFASENTDGVRVLAAYTAPEADFWLADLPLQHIPAHVFEAWQALYGINLSADFLTNQSLVVSGAYGRGRYVLSYSHLETPQSPDANAWLAHLLRRLAGLEPRRELVPGWELGEPAPAWPDYKSAAPLLDALRRTRALLDLAVEHHLFFRRAPWLWGWRTGLPGAACNNLHAALCTAVSIAPSGRALDYWRGIRPRFAELAALFASGAEGYLLACRLAETLSPTLPDAVDKRGLDNQREALFGHPMHGGGIMEELLDMAEELIYLSQDADALAR